MKKLMRNYLLSLLVIFFAFAQLSYAKENASTTEKSLLVYSGAGLKKPMTVLAKEFSEKHHVKVEYIFAGSAQLLSQLELSGKGDVFIVGSKVTYEAAQQKHLVGSAKQVAYHTPVIVVKAGNPKHIFTLQDLQKPGLKIILGDPKANAIGATTQQIIKKNRLEGINKNTVALTATVNEIILHLTEGRADAAIATKDSVFGNDKLEAIAIPENENVGQILPIAPVTFSKEKDLANQFVDFVASDSGKAVFAQYGFTPVK